MNELGCDGKHTEEMISSKCIHIGMRICFKNLSLVMQCKQVSSSHEKIEFITYHGTPRHNHICPGFLASLSE